MNKGDKLYCIREFVDRGGNHRFSVGELVNVISLSLSFCKIARKVYDKNKIMVGTRDVLLEWDLIDDYFETPKERRNKIINELIK